MRGGQSYSLAGEACGPGLVCRGWSHSREKSGRIIAKGFIQEAEGSDGAANYEARKPALRMYCLDGSLLHPVQPIQVGRSCPHPDDWAVLHNRPDKGFVGSKPGRNSQQVKCLAQGSKSLRCSDYDSSDMCARRGRFLNQCSEVNLIWQIIYHVTEFGREAVNVAPKVDNNGGFPAIVDIRIGFITCSLAFYLLTSVCSFSLCFCSCNICLSTTLASSCGFREELGDLQVQFS